MSARKNILVKAVAVMLFEILAIVAAVGCGGSPEQQAVAVEITSLETPEGALRPGSPADVFVRIRNTGTEEYTFWIGYSVQDSTGRWYDAPAIPTKLASGVESDTQKLSTEPLETPGYYNTRVSVWSEKPEGERTGGGDGDAGNEAQRLADAQEPLTFRISGLREDFDSFEENRWAKPAQELGRGSLDPANVDVEDGKLRIKIPADTLDGGEIESKDLYEEGFYAARIKVPDAPSSITAFFLYAPPDYASEIDIEIYNDSSRKIMFTTYADGVQTHTETMHLPFDPTEDFHDYAFSYNRNSVTFYVNGEPMKRYEGGLPNEPMKLYVNSWFPTWLDGEEPDSDRYAYVDWIEY